jgi:putative membrane protein
LKEVAEFAVGAVITDKPAQTVAHRFEASGAIERGRQGMATTQPPDPRGQAMMYWYGDGSHWWMLVLTILFVVPLWIAIAIAIVAVSKSDRTSANPPNASMRPSPEALLAERFASGELDETEYLHRLSVLHPGVKAADPRRVHP